MRGWVQEVFAVTGGQGEPEKIFPWNIFEGECNPLPGTINKNNQIPGYLLSSNCLKKEEKREIEGGAIT
jgi:hypothetical protein